ncbi:MAG: glutamine-hydrolyzing carbamoyl-phosphate synthase small subunit [Thermoleophilia bacterium]
MYRSDIPGYVVLEDGTVFQGFGFATSGRVVGEIVFNTSMTGYQEVATDPSYHGQMVAFTYPMIGNYGAGEHLLESGSVHSKAVVVREVKNTNYNRTCPDAWVEWLNHNGVVGVGGVDTRALTRRIRERGAMTACVAAGSEFRVNDLLEEVRAFPSMSGQDLAREVTCARPYPVGEPDAHFHVVAFDYGMKRSILKNLLEVGCRVTVVPAHWTAAQVLQLEPDGVFLSNGPGDPEPVNYAVEAIRGLLGRVPVFGICLGHQLLALAVGFKTYKLKFGHRGINHPVKNYLRDAIEITSQNHGFAVESLPLVAKVAATGGDLSAIDPALMIADSTVGAVQVTHLNLNDGTVEGLRLRDVPAFSVQYHPEAGPGPHDSIYLFREFVDLMEGWKARE